MQKLLYISEFLYICVDISESESNVAFKVGDDSESDEEEKPAITEPQKVEGTPAPEATPVQTPVPTVSPATPVNTEAPSPVQQEKIETPTPTPTPTPELKTQEPGVKRTMEELVSILKTVDGAKLLSDEDVLALVKAKHIPAYKLETSLDDYGRGVEIR